MPPETKIGVFPWQSSDLFEAINTARALRRFKPDPVPDEVLSKILEAGIRAPSGSSEQTWLFVVVKDPEQRRKLGEVYRKGGGILMAHTPTGSSPSIWIRSRTTS